MKLGNYDYYLIILTIAILFGTGILCVYGIAYYNYLAVDPNFARTIKYTEYVDGMNSYLYPLLVLLLISLGLCIPKRLLERDVLLKFSASIFVVTLILTVLSGIMKALAFILAVMMGIQGIVLVMTLRKSRGIRYEKEGYTARLGSSLLHLGLVVLVFNFVALGESPFHIPIFWAGTLLVGAGSMLSFYSDKISTIM